MIRKNLLEVTPGRYRQKPEEEEDDEDDEENKSNNSNNIPSPDLHPCQDDSWLQISCKLSLAHPVMQSWKHLAPDNIEYYRSSSAHVRTWLLGVRTTKKTTCTYTHTHEENNLQNNTHTINRRNISPNPSIRSTKNNNKSFLRSYLAFRTPDNTHHPLLLLLLLLLLFFFFFF